MSTDRYARQKRQRQEERRLKVIAETTAKIARLAQQIYALDAAAGRPPDQETMAVVEQARKLLGIKP